MKEFKTITIDHERKISQGNTVAIDLDKVVYIEEINSFSTCLYFLGGTSISIAMTYKDFMNENNYFEKYYRSFGPYKLKKNVR